MGHLAAFSLILFAVLPGEEAYRSAKHAEREARYKDAINEYRACVDSQGPLAPYARIRAAVCLRLRGKPRGAIDELTALIGDSPEGPWVPLAEHELGQSYYADSNYDLAAVHFERADSAPVNLWWLDDVRWTAAENLLRIPASRPQALTFFRSAAERAPWQKKRRAASMILVSSGDPQDVLSGAMGLIRSGALDEAEAAIEEVKDDALEIDGLENRWRYAMGRLLMARNDLQNEGVKALEALTKELSGEPLARRAISDLIAHNLRRKDFAAAEKLLGRLEEWDRRSSESIAAHGLLARAYVREKRLEEAIEHYRPIAGRAPYASTRQQALLDQGNAYRKLENEAEALSAYQRLIELYPRSASAVEAAFWSGELLRGNGAKDDALGLYRHAVQHGVTRYYGYRAQESLARLGDEAAQSMPVLPAKYQTGGSGGGKIPNRWFRLVRPLSIQTRITVDELDLPGKDASFLRLQFFGLEGYDEAEWEAMFIGRELNARDSHGKLYQAMGRAGAAYTAMQIADAHGFGENGDGTQTADRLRIRYPLAYWETVQAAAKEAGLDPYLILSIARQESTYRPGLESVAGAVGVMQVMPRTARAVAEANPGIGPVQEHTLKHPPTSIRLGAHYLRQMIDRYDGNLVYALASYNAGPSNCDKWRKRFAGSSLADFVESIPFAETQDYVKRVLAHYATYHSLYAAAP